MGFDLRRSLDIVASISMIVAATIIVILYGPKLFPKAGPGTPKLPTAPVSIAGLAAKGRPDAPIAIIEYSDFQCPFCGRFSREFLPALEEKYVNTGQVVLTFKHLPIEGLHSFALPAAVAAECAARQQQFWPMHDWLFSKGVQLDDANLSAYVRTAGLDVGGYDACVKGDGLKVVRTHQAEAEALGINVTPSFLIGTLGLNQQVTVKAVISGMQPLTQFSAQIDKLLPAR